MKKVSPKLNASRLNKQIVFLHDYNTITKRNEIWARFPDDPYLYCVGIVAPLGDRLYTMDLSASIVINPKNDIGPQLERLHGTGIAGLHNMHAFYLGTENTGILQ